MIVSMTGYGQAEKKNKQYEFNVEIKAINNRFMDIVLKTNSNHFQYEKEIFDFIKKKCSRGRINININIQSNSSENKLGLDMPKLNSYIYIVNKIKKEIKVRDSLTLNNILNIPDLIKREESSDVNIRHKNIIMSTIKSAIINLEEFRKKEGLNLFKDIKNIYNKINIHLKRIETIANTHSKKELIHYKNKIKSIFPDLKKLDNDRIYQEIAIIIEKKDINEEIIRLKSHLKLFNTYLNNKEYVGKKMNFLLQEMTREINTIGSKSDKVRINHLVVDVKDNLEKIKEQVQNIL